MNEPRIRENCRIALERLHSVHIRTIADSKGPVVYISDTYPGVWLEHVYDGLVWAQLTGDYAPARNYISLFIKLNYAKCSWILYRVAKNGSTLITGCSFF